MCTQGTILATPLYGFDKHHYAVCITESFQIGIDNSMGGQCLHVLFVKLKLCLLPWKYFYFIYIR